MIYLASPYEHEKAVVREVLYGEACQFSAAMMRAGLIPFSPVAQIHGMFEYGLPNSPEFWRTYWTSYIEACDAVWVLTLDHWKECKQMRTEINIAFEMEKPVSHVPFFRKDNLEYLQALGSRELGKSE